MEGEHQEERVQEVEASQESSLEHHPLPTMSWSLQVQVEDQDLTVGVSVVRVDIPEEIQAQELKPKVGVELKSLQGRVLEVHRLNWQVEMVQVVTTVEEAVAAAGLVEVEARVKVQEVEVAVMQVLGSGISRHSMETMVEPMEEVRLWRPMNPLPTGKVR